LDEAKGSGDEWCVMLRWLGGQKKVGKEREKDNVHSFDYNGANSGNNG
jgi:hypothetical protein